MSQKSKKKKLGTASGGDFGRFLIDFGAFLEVRGGPKWGLKRCRAKTTKFEDSTTRLDVFGREKLSKNGRKSGPKRSRGVPGGPKSSKIRFPGPWGVQGGSRGAPRRSRRHNMSQKKTENENWGRPPGQFWAIFGRFLVDFGAFLGSGGVKKRV